MVVVSKDLERELAADSSPSRDSTRSMSAVDMRIQHSSETTPAPGSSLREQKKNATRQAIEDAAWELFREKGFDATSVNDIAARANVAQRTFFRYFPVKEAVLFGELDEGLEKLAEAFRAMPPEMPLFAGMVAAFDSVAATMNKDRVRAELRFEILSAAGMAPVCDYVQGQFVQLATDLVREREGNNPHVELHAKLVAGVLMVVQAVANDYWLEHGSEIGFDDAGRFCVSELISMLTGGATNCGAPQTAGE